MKVTLKDLRENSGLTQSDVAKELNVSINTVKSWEEYKTFPDSFACLKMCEIMNCHIDDIFFPDKLADSEQDVFYGQQ